MRNGKGGTYVESYSLARNFELEEDIMETMTSNILKLVEKPIFQILEEVDNLEGIMIRVTIKAQIDDSDITRWLNKNDNEKSILVAQNEALRKSNREQEHQIAELKRQFANLRRSINTNFGNFSVLCSEHNVVPPICIVS